MADSQNGYQLMEINLLPSEFRQNKLNLSWILDSRVMWSTFALILVALVLSLLYYHVIETTNELQKAVAQTKQAIERERPLLDKIAELEKKQKVIKEKSDALRSIQVSRKRWVLMFEDFSTTLPPGTWISGIIQEGDVMNLSCATWHFPEVALYMLKLEQTQSVTEVSLTNINAVKINNEDAYNFSLRVRFNPNLGLETGVR
ncbi:MAG: PilN domain-containing protein [Fibromonadaceae bacterium]|jgi:type IV pilus assembly protein PilN|nr:PilN domain-containing protein [Fibromonadaceae bacterium]